MEYCILTVLSLFLENWEEHADVKLVQCIQTGKQQAAGHGGDSTSSTEEEACGEDKQECNSGPEDSDSSSEFDISNKFSILGVGE
jgi:hypothetical protein